MAHPAEFESATSAFGEHFYLMLNDTI